MNDESAVEEKKVEDKGHSDIQQYLTFTMGDDEYGVDILSVQEIHGWIDPRPMPDTPNYVKGVIDWRGAVVPIFDLRIRFDYESVTYDKSTVVIILKSKTEQTNKDYIMGIVVDAVCNVHDITDDLLKVAPQMGGNVDTRYIKGMTKIDDSMIIVLDLNKLIDIEKIL